MTNSQWVIEALADGELVRIASDGTEEGTLFTVAKESVEDDVRLMIKQGRRPNLIPDGPRIPASYSAVGIMAALVAAYQQAVVYRVLPDDAIKFLKEEYGIKHVNIAA